MASSDEILAEARAAIAAGREPDAEALRARIRAVGGDTDRVLAQLERVLAVHRARTRLVERPAPKPEPAARPRPRGLGALRTRPTVSGNMDVRRGADTRRTTLAWDRAPGVVGWEVRRSERPDPRRDYAVLEETTLPPETTELEVRLGERPVRIHLLGRRRDGKLLRHAIVSGLTPENWRDRWQRRATAA